MSSITQSPFKFLEPYSKEDKLSFFGREEETERLFQLITRGNIALIYGPSGTGKTSIVRAGLFNRLDDADHLPIFIRREQNINESVRKNLMSIIDFHAEGSIVEILARAYERYLRNIILVFDQLEELFILGNEEEKHIFGLLLQEILEATTKCKVILIIREEYFGRLYELEKYLPSIFDHRLEVEPMRLSAIRNVILASAQVYNIQIVEQEMVVDQIIDNLRGHNGVVSMVNLQVYLDRLYSLAYRSKPDGDIIFDPELVHALGAIEDVLSLFLDEQLEVIQMELSRQVVHDVGNLPLYVLAKFLTEEGMLKPMGWDTIIHEVTTEKYVSSQLVEHCLFRLEELNLIRLNNEDEKLVLELAHSSLGQLIFERLDEEYRQQVKIRKLIQDSYNQYQEGYGGLFTEQQLQLIDPYFEKLNLSEGQRVFVYESREVGQRRIRERRKRIILFLSLVAMIIVLLIGYIVWLHNKYVI